MSGVVVRSQAREIIYKLYEFMKQEKESKDFIIPVDRLYERLAEATGISSRTIKRIIQEGRSKPVGKKEGFIDEVEELIFTVNTGESDEEIDYSSSDKDSDSELDSN
ncbi:hypothetical protein FQA39_LY08324 [Lamprigera yunnana]|nr:hypothetical protein FQA39_LY08324 [Lamprigera yunnana]